MGVDRRFTRHLELGTLLGVSAGLLGVRLFAATRVGFGDSEALYAAYALHPQPAYLDHPGFVGVLARAIGVGTAPGPERAHVVTSVLSTLVPWTMVLACRACGASWPRSLVAALVVALVPEVAIGMFALTPDLPLALAWNAALALGASALGSKPGSARAAWGFASAGVFAGAAAASKMSGVMLMAGLAVAYASRPARPHARTIAPWAGLAAGALVMLPVASFEMHHGWPMVRHRLIDTQAAAGLSLRNVGTLVGGQLAYLSPLTAVLAAISARELWRGRGDAKGRLLVACCVVPFSVLLPLGLWSRVAEPHWLAPALLALAPAGARAKPNRLLSQGLLIPSCALAGAMVVSVYAWVLVPSLLSLAPPTYEPRLDLANELYGWPDVLRAVREEVRVAAANPAAERRGIAVVGPHWVICAQLDAALRGEFHVGCNTPIRDDFDDWWPRDLWRRADIVVWVTDARFPVVQELPSHATLRTREVAIERGGRTVRTFTIATLGRRATAEALPGACSDPAVPSCPCQ
jgi:dolichyl-phosphate-mannose-protein mannosyltransferase